MFVRQTLILCLLGLALAAPSAKINPDLARSLKRSRLVNIFVHFHGGNAAAIQRASHAKFASRGEAITNLVDILKAHAESTQSNALNLLRARSPYSAETHQVFWISNDLYIKGADAALVNQLASLPEVEELHAENIEIVEEPAESSEIAPNAEWGIEIIQAQQAWALPGGNNGAGVVVSNIDTGVRHTHESLRNNYRSDRGWFDPYTGTSQPSDSNGHGTHTMGTIAGSGGIGVAPGSQWIACRGCSGSGCTESALKSCGQWVLCPTLPGGESPDCSKAPVVVSNSWGGGQGREVYNEMIAAWKAADIIPVFSNGNSGPSCGSANSPADQEVIAVGSTTSNDDISSFSSVGPSIRGVLKPEISAPGSSVRSAWSSSDSAYNTISGTSMSCPHVSGTVALLRAANPSLKYDAIRSILIQNTDTNLVDTGRTCSGIPSTQFPNHQYGYGRLNARKALAAAVSGKF